MLTAIFLIVGFAVLFAYAILGAMRPVIALATSSVATLVLAAVAHEYGSAEGMVLAVLVIPAALLGIITGSSRARAPVWTKTLAGVFLIALAVLGFMAIFAIFSGPFWVIIIVAGGLLIRFALISRDTLATLVFSTIGAAMRQNLPLTDTLEFEARAHDGKRMRILRSICSWISQGYPLSESLRRGYPQCPGYALAMVTAAERIQQVPRAIASIEADLAQRNRESRKLQPMSAAYPLGVLLVAFVIISLLMVFVIPNFQRIFAGIGEELPATTRMLMFFARDGTRGLFSLVGFFILVGVAINLYTKFRPRRPEKSYLLSQAGDWVKWRLPMFRWFERNRSLVQTISFLRLSLSAGTTIDDAIAGACELDVNGCYRQRVRRWLDRVTAGEGVSSAALKSGLSPAIAWAFDPEVNPGGALRVLETLESFYRSQYAYAANLGRLIFWPCVTLALAALVGTIVYGMFAPMVTLIESNIRWVLP